jgi:uncharacterized protein YndB with AHSA1/START domain
MKTAANLKVTTPSDREIMMTRVFDAPRSLVFDCYTRPELLKRWLHGPDGWLLVVCDNDLRVGGAFRWVWRNADGREMGMGGVHREIVRPERIVRTELFDQDWTGGEAVGTLAFTARRQDHGCDHSALCVAGGTRRRPQVRHGERHHREQRQAGCAAGVGTGPGALAKCGLKRPTPKAPKF